jgi:hypothetical protein
MADRIQVQGEVSGVQIKPGNNSQIKARLIITFDPDNISWEALKEIAKRGTCDIDITAKQRSMELGAEPTAIASRSGRGRRRNTAINAPPEGDGDDEGDGSGDDDEAAGAQSFGDPEALEDAEAMLEPDALPVA